MRTFPFRILTPSGTIVGGDVTHVQVRTQIGSLGVMARHAPMVVACPAGLVRIQQEGVWVEFKTDDAILTTDGTEAVLLTAHAQLSGIA
jgi:F0F1-type ATP synthase epsilon subunit